jgi:adenosylhomocysteine nucleosidase
VVATGDTFIISAQKRDELRSRLGADAVEMEGAAIAQICYQRGIGHIVIRGICDTADKKALEDANTFQDIACNNSATVVLKMMELMESQQLLGQGRQKQ